MKKENLMKLRFAPRNRYAISGIKSWEFLFEKFLRINYGEIFFDNFAILIGVARRRRAKGFTLIEIMLVIIIIGILVAMVTPQFVGRSEKARMAAARADIEANLSTVLDLYELDNGQYPTTEQGLKALMQEPTQTPIPQNWSGPYLKKREVPKDPWGHEYVYAAPGVHNPDMFDLASYGPDGIESSDDIVNWVKDGK